MYVDYGYWLTEELVESVTSCPVVHIEPSSCYEVCCGQVVICNDWVAEDNTDHTKQLFRQTATYYEHHVHK